MRLHQAAALLALATLAALTACRSLPPPPPENLAADGWTIRQGQALWRPNQNSPEIAGELLAADHQDGRLLVQFTKGPFPLVVARVTSNNWHISFSSAQHTRSGRGRPPSRILWFHLPAALQGANTAAPLDAERLPGGRFRLEDPRTGERIEGFTDTIQVPSTHRVASGENLTEVARRYGLATEAITAANPGPLHDWFGVGRSIRLPQPDASPSPAVSTPPQ